MLFSAFFRSKHKIELFLVSTGGSATASAFEFPALGPDEGLDVRAGGSSGAKVTVGLPSGSASLHQNRILTCGCLQSELVKGHHLTAGLQNTLTGFFCHMQCSNLKWITLDFSKGLYRFWEQFVGAKRGQDAVFSIHVGQSARLHFNHHNKE